MIANLKMFKSDGERKNGFPIKLIVSHKGKQKRKTIACVKEINWDAINNIPLSGYSNYLELHSQIINIRSKALKNDFKKLTDFNQAINYLLDIEFAPDKIDFYKYAQKRIEFMQSQKREGNAEAYMFAIAQLKKYKPTLYFDEITTGFLENFKISKLQDNAKHSTIRTYLYEIRAIYNSCVRVNSLVDKRPFAGLFSDLRVKKRRAKNVYLGKVGIKSLKDYNSNFKTQNRTVDLSLLQFYLGGLDLVDVYYLKYKQINKDRVYLKRAKLGVKAETFDVKLFDCAKKIIDKYKVPGKGDDYVFPWRKDRTGYKTFRSTHNKSLKKIIIDSEIDVLPVPAPFTTKAIRHSFATIAKFLMINADIIRELMGHERNDIDTIYKDLYPQDVRDEAHWKIIE